MICAFVSAGKAAIMALTANHLSGELDPNNRQQADSCAAVSGRREVTERSIRFQSLTAISGRAIRSDPLIVQGRIGYKS